MRFQHLAMCGALCSLLACSASTPQNARGTGSPGSGGNSSSSGVTGGGPGTTDNPTGVLPAPDASVSTPTADAAVASNLPPGPISIDQTGAGNPAGLADTDVKTLIAGGAPGTMKWLYPYDATIFPRGMISPLLMWDGPSADVVYLHIKAQQFEYKGVLKAAMGGPMMNAPQLQIPQDVWDKAGAKTGGKSDTFTMELTARSSGAVAGPITLHFTIAQATVKGSIYYNTYASQLPNAAAGGNVLRIPPGGKAELFLSTGCNGCHSVSANGSRMISQIAIGIGGQSFDLMSGGAANPMGAAAGPRTAFGALYPDGSKYLSTSVAVPLAHADIAQAIGASSDSALYDTATGNVVPDTGVPVGALMPMFSPDGTRLVFNDNAINSAHGLALMDYDVKTDKATNYKMLATETDNLRPGWPFFLPDAKAVVYVSTDGSEFDGNGAFVGAGNLAGPFSAIANVPIEGPNSDLKIVDAATGTANILAKAMGFNTPADATSGTTYLPFGAEDIHHSYFPTVSAVAAGGYFWVFFDSIRHYGNLGLQRQLWGAAIDISADGSYKLDPSHPPFYLPGQEFGAGNHRAFAALDPCKKDGDTCASGIDCCGGFCYITNMTELVTPTGTCTPKMNTCAKTDERCTTSSDCCPPTAGQPANSCIAGYCAVVQLM